MQLAAEDADDNVEDDGGDEADEDHRGKWEVNVEILALNAEIPRQVAQRWEDAGENEDHQPTKGNRQTDDDEKASEGFHGIYDLRF